MPRYFFHVHDGRSIPDHDGIDMPDLNAAKREAIRYASALLADEGEEIWQGQDWHMEVSDDTGAVLLRIDFAAKESASPSSEG